MIFKHTCIILESWSYMVRLQKFSKFSNNWYHRRHFILLQYIKINTSGLSQKFVGKIIIYGKKIIESVKNFFL